MTADDAHITVDGMARDLAAGVAGPARVDISDAGVMLARDSGAPVVANFRDVSVIAVDHGRLLLVIGDGAARFLVEGLGDRLGLVVSELRERRARQALHDRFIEVPTSERLELVEYQVADEHGVAQVAYHAWGVALLPVDERHTTRLVRRADISSVTADGSTGSVALQLRPRPGTAADAPINLLSLGAGVEHHRARLAALRDGALADAAAIVARLLPDAPFMVRQVGSGALVDGRPVSAAELEGAWPFVERAVLVDPVFAASYRALVAHGTVSGKSAPVWLSLAPRTPGQTDEYMAWFFVGLPGNLIAFELVSQGAHATYLFRVLPRSAYEPQLDDGVGQPLTAAVSDISESLIDARFLREPIYLTETALLDPGYTRYRFAIAALPTLRAARWRFVGRLIHSDDASWSAALDDAIRFNSSTRDDTAVWPGGASVTDEQESD